MDILWYFNIVHEMCYEKASLFSIKMIFIPKTTELAKKLELVGGMGWGLGRKEERQLVQTKRKKITQNKL